jgi:hypothetical protein
MKPHISAHRRVWTAAITAVLLCSVLVLAGATAASAADPPPADCGYSGCHNGEPIPGTETTSAPVPATLSKPIVPKKPRARKLMAIDGSLLPAHDETTTVSVTLARKVGKRYSTWKTVSAYLSPGATRYRVTVRMPRKGTWRLRSSHSDALHLVSYSPYRGFSVK